MNCLYQAGILSDRVTGNGLGKGVGKGRPVECFADRIPANPADNKNRFGHSLKTKTSKRRK